MLREPGSRRRRRAKRTKVPAAAKTPMAKVEGSGTGTTAGCVKWGPGGGGPSSPVKITGTTSVIPSWSFGTSASAVPQRVPSHASISTYAVWPGRIPGTATVPPITQPVGTPALSKCSTGLPTGARPSTLGPASIWAQMPVPARGPSIEPMCVGAYPMFEKLNTPCGRPLNGIKTIVAANIIILVIIRVNV